MFLLQPSFLNTALTFWFKYTVTKKQDIVNILKEKV